MLKRNPHRPAHLLLDSSAYFITGSIYEKRHLLDDDLKNDLINLMKQEFARCNWDFSHWVILDNHYHVMVNSFKGEDLPKIIGRLHFKSGKLIRKKVISQSPIWWNYWDYCPRNEKDYFVRLNYLLNNPVKHGYVEKLNAYPYSSFHQYLGRHGREELVSQFKKHPEYQRIELENDDF
ncbi:MAG: transposase [Methylobacter sp.]|nr:transposase [Methylobacter sp.]MDP2430092.1 transposase [Methylobacter sp.]MDP3054938.1 transposase [Methylobacter sp.]MDP3362256.1 transposase [Methylobacter sp.]